MNNLDFSFKDLYGLRLKATYNTKINGQEVEENETIAFFNSIQIANINEIVKRAVARGGYHNLRHVFWESTDKIRIEFGQGVFSKTQFSLISNSPMFNIAPSEEIAMDFREQAESDEDGLINLKYRPANYLFCYDAETGEKLSWQLTGEQTLDIGDSYKEVILDYQRICTSGGKQIVLGENAIKGFLSLEAKIRTKDDVTGENRLGIIKIPKVKLMSDLSLRLGRNANPSVGGFAIEGYPIGEKGKERVMEIFFLDEIDHLDLEGKGEMEILDEIENRH